MRVRAATIMAAAVLLGACGGAEDEQQEPLGYVLLDLEAQEAGWHLDGFADAGLPAAVAADEEVALIGPEHSEVLAPEPGELWYVRGDDGAVERYGIGDEVTDDSVYVVGTEEAAKRLAKLVGADVESVDDAVWRLAAPHALTALADSMAPAGMDELVPLAVEDAQADQQDPSVWSSAEVAGHALRGAVSGQRFGFAAAARLPVAQLMGRQIKCADPVEGLWVSRRFDPTILDWHLFTMEVRRDAEDPSQLTGRIRTRNWSGSSGDGAPAECAQMGRASYGHRFDLTVEMTAQGSFDGQSISFQGANWAEKARRCGPYGQWYNYHLDHFTGTVLEDGKTIDAVNNDGARAFDEAHTLHRVGCL
jgi:hypothetical protein